MKKIIVISYIIVALIIYYSLTLVILPSEYLLHPESKPQPRLEVQLVNSEISLGETFEMQISSTNFGDSADVLIVSAAFPGLTELKDIVKITSYDFTQSPHYISVGDKIGAKYSGGKESVDAKYPSIEAYSRPVSQESTFHMIFQVTPKEAGVFKIYTKTVAVPHNSELSHFPHSGEMDHQGEFVDIYSVNVLGDG